MPACKTCGCPLTVLKGLTGRPEKRTTCARCHDASMAPKSRVSVYHAPAVSRANNSASLRIDAFLNGKNGLKAPGPKADAPRKATGTGTQGGAAVTK